MTQVLDHGQVHLLGVLGNDLSVVGAARVSTGKDPESASKGEESDRRLIDFLMRNGHGTPFEHAVFQFYVKLPIFVEREWIRHRMASTNEWSARYSELKPEFYRPKHVRVPDPANKQSSVVDAYDESKDWLDRYEAPYRIEKAAMDAYNVYQELLVQGVAREMARLVLPVNIYTAKWWTVNARSLMNFLALRNHHTAQWEIQQYALAIEDDFQAHMPWTHDAFLNNGRRAP